MIDKPGIYTIPSEEYHDDPLPTPSLSASIAKALVNETPSHAYSQHPRLNPAFVREEAGNMDIGSICHGLLLEGVSKAHVMQTKKTEGQGKNKITLDEPVENFMTKAAKEERDWARSQGLYPILQCDWEQAQLMVASARGQLDAHRDAKDAFTAGKPEQTIIWQEENGVWCRARTDWLHDSLTCIDDYKTRSGTAEPKAVERTLFKEGWHIQAAFYLRGLAMVDPPADRFSLRQRKFRFICHETFAPYALSVIELHEWALAVATKQVLWAIETFGECLKTGKWEGYSKRTYPAMMPEWMENAWNEKEVGGK